MIELIRDRLKKSISKDAILYLRNGFRYEGEVLNVDDSHVEILDFRSNRVHLILISDIKDMEIDK